MIANALSTAVIREASRAFSGARNGDDIQCRLAHASRALNDGDRCRCMLADRRRNDERTNSTEDTP